MTFKEIFFDKDFDSLNNMIRWNRQRRIKDETVAHHSYMVVLFTRILCEELRESAEVTLDAVTYAIFHDHDEIFTADIIHGFKHNELNGKELRKIIDAYIFHQSNEKFQPSIEENNIGKMLHKNIISNPEEIGYFTKEIVKLCDWLSMLFYLFKELSFGNRNVNEDLVYCMQKTREHIENNFQPFKQKVLLDIFEQIFEQINNYDYDID